MSLLDKIKKNSTIKMTSEIKNSKVFGKKEFVKTGIIGLDIAMSGSLEGGLESGLTIFAGPSKHFKTLYTLICAKAYMDKYPDAVLLFYDSEFGTPLAYFAALDIDMDRVIHSPITDVEQLKFDVMGQLDGIERGDKVFIAIDSIGNLASKKEVEDALNQKSVADMSRAKQIKSLFRMVTPHLTIKDIPMVAVNHTYMTQEMFSKAVVSGGTGIYYSADNIFIIGRQQEKDGGDLAGYNFVINVEKSRHTREKSKIPITVLFDGGINRYSGLMDIALEGQFTAKPKNGWYSRVNPETGEMEEKNYRIKDTMNKEFWDPILSSTKFQEYIRSKYSISHGKLMEQENNIPEGSE
jgi:RecA/RadA recombinase